MGDFKVKDFIEGEKERVVDVTAINLLANFKPVIPENALTTLADTVEKEVTYFFRAIQANGVNHARISLDKMKTSGKIHEQIFTESKRQRFMAMAGILTINIKPYLKEETIAHFYGFGTAKEMAVLVPELCRGDGHMKFSRGESILRDMLKMVSTFNVANQ